MHKQYYLWAHLFTKRIYRHEELEAKIYRKQQDTSLAI